MSTPPSDIPIGLVGCDFRVASSRWRSKLVLDDAESLELASELERTGWADGIVNLSTCNRNEWIVSSDEPRWAAELLRSRMLERLNDSGRARIQPYLMVGDEAARHLFRVAIGQESLVVGERQIAGQLFKALEHARSRGTSTRILNGIGAIAGRLVRIAIRRGCVGSSASGVHALALTYLRHRARKRPISRVAVVGLGAIGRRVHGLLANDPDFEVVPINRTANDSHVVPLTELADQLTRCDAAIVCTGARAPIITTEMLHLGHSAEQPLELIDIGIPHQVERNELPEGVRVAGLDELTTFHELSNMDKETPCSAAEADALVDRAVEELRRFASEPAFTEVLDTLQREQERLTAETIPNLVRERFAYLASDDQQQLEHDLRGLLLAYNSRVFRTIREAAKHQAEAAWDRDN